VIVTGRRDDCITIFQSPPLRRLGKSMLGRGVGAG
jgi:hypothetical protein